MTKTFVYQVNGVTFETTEAFGKVWEEVLALAKAEHSPIFRQVIIGEEIRNEFLAKGGFLNEKYYSDEKVELF